MPRGLRSQMHTSCILRPAAVPLLAVVLQRAELKASGGSAAPPINKLEVSFASELAILAAVAFFLCRRGGGEVEGAMELGSCSSVGQGCWSWLLASGGVGRPECSASGAPWWRTKVMFCSGANIINRISSIYGNLLIWRYVAAILLLVCLKGRKLASTLGSEDLCDGGLGAAMVKEQDFQCSCRTLLSLLDGDLAEEAVLLLFGFFHQRWPTTSLLLIPRFNRGDTLRLSSVLLHIYLQLKSPLPQVHTPDRPSGESPAGHQLVWSTEALGDCGCSILESYLSTDDRWLFGSIGNLRFLHVVYQCTILHSFCAARHICFLLCSKEPCNDVL